jgi:hypothetical protein
MEGEDVEWKVHDYTRNRMHGSFQTILCLVNAHECAYGVGTGQYLRGKNSEWLEEEGSRRKVSNTHVKFWRRDLESRRTESECS